MKLWVAEGVLCDYTCGIAVIHAKSEKEAIEELWKADELHFWMLYNTPQCQCHKHLKTDWSKTFYKYHKPTRLPLDFKLVTDAKAFTCSGGG